MSIATTTTTSPASITGSNVKAEMARRGISQTALAEHLGITQAAISTRIRGLVAFDINELVAVAAFLEVPITALIPTPIDGAA